MGVTHGDRIEIGMGDSIFVAGMIGGVERGLTFLLCVEAEVEDQRQQWQQQQQQAQQGQDQQHQQQGQAQQPQQQGQDQQHRQQGRDQQHQQQQTAGAEAATAAADGTWRGRTMQQVQEARKRRREREKQKRREGVQQRQQVEAGLAAFSSGNFFVRPPTRHAPYRIPAVGGLAAALPLPASCAQELRAPNGQLGGPSRDGRLS